MNEPESPTAETARRARFEAIHAAHGRAVLGFAVRRVAQADDARDVVADTFLVAWRRLDDMPGGDADRLWLYGVARRVLANQRRGARRRRRLGARLGTAIAEHLVVHDHADATGATAELATALASLPAEDRELLQLVAWEGLTSAQLGEVLGIPAPTVRTRLHRARRRLRAAMADAAVDASGDVGDGKRTPAGEHASAAGHEGTDGQPLVREKGRQP
jgi:RNA polymerase sigma-70 factor (ECF subfamily)